VTMRWDDPRQVTRLIGATVLVGALAAGVMSLAADGPLAADGERAVKAPLAETSLLLGVAARGSRLVAVGERGHVLVSADSGATWTQADVPTRAMLTAVVMVNDREGYAVGHDQVVIRTRDGGTTWERVHNAPEREQPLLDVWFADANTGLAIGAYGSTLMTPDGGATWTEGRALANDDFHLNQVSAGPDGALYLAAEAGHLYRSDDHGATWAPLVSPYDGSFFGVLARPDGSILAYGLRGHLFRSDDRGTTWTQLATGSDESLTCALDLGGGRFVVGGMAGTLLWSDAAGHAVQKQELPDRKAIAALAPGTGDTVLVFGEGGHRRVPMAR
jgi:photosystem II stability/assembly factor-like uncharacterized protein